jgi:hypothetical protein
MWTFGWTFGRLCDRRRSLSGIAVAFAVVLAAGAPCSAADEPKPDPSGIATGERSFTVVVFDVEA